MQYKLTKENRPTSKNHSQKVDAPEEFCESTSTDGKRFTAGCALSKCVTNSTIRKKWMEIKMRMQK